MANKLQKSLTALLIIFAITIRLCALADVPSGLTVDEADIGYDAYSLIKTGRDQWGEKFPIVGFRGFGDYRPVLYTYLVVPSFMLFGVNNFSLRLPSALFGILSVAVLYLLVKKILNRKIAAMAGFLMAVSPWAIGMSRLAIESNVAVFFLLLGIYLLTFVKTKKYVAAGAVLCFTATIYLYTAYTLFTPLLSITLLFYYKDFVFNNKKIILIALIFFIILITPFAATDRAGFFSRASTEGFLVNTDSVGIIQNINEKRGSCLEIIDNPLLCRLVANKAVEFFRTFLNNYLHHLSISYLYTSGTPVQRVILPEMGLFYIFELPLFLFGVFANVKKIDKKIYKLLLSILFIAAVPSALTGNGNFSRFSMAMPIFLTIEAIGMAELLKNFRPIHKKVFAAIVVFSVVFFTINYFTYFRYKYSTKLTYKELVEDIKTAKNKYQKIYVSNYKVDTEMHVYYLYYTLYDPVSYQNKNKVSYSQKPNGWTSVDKIDNIYFVPGLPEKIEADNLYIAPPEKFPKDIAAKKNIKNLGGGTILLEVEAEKLLEYKTD